MVVTLFWAYPAFALRSGDDHVDRWLNNSPGLPRWDRVIAVCHRQQEEPASGGPTLN